MKPKNVASAMPWLALSLMLGACQSRPTQLPRPMADHVTPLLQHPQFQAAARAAPDFTREALDAVIRLSKETADHE